MERRLDFEMNKFGRIMQASNTCLKYEAGKSTYYIDRMSFVCMFIVYVKAASGKLDAWRNG